ncbi:MAG: DNA polymerase domain-containing protein, partial [Candidatus Nanohaloarchaea archaeon]
MELDVRLMDIDYVIEDGGAAIRFYAKSGEKNVYARDEDFLPYFYAVPSEEGAREAIESGEFSHEGDELEVRKVEKERKSDSNEEVEVLRVYTDVPPNVPKLKSEIEELPEVEECREHDIPFYKRYLIDNGIRPTETFRVEGEEFEDGNFDVALEVESLETGVESEEDWRNWNVLAFDLEVYEDEVVMASFAARDYEKLLTTAEVDREFSEKVDSEKQLLERFMEIIEERDVDVLLGYNTDEFDFDVLRERCQEHGLELALGRNGERMKFERRGRFSSARLKGRMHLDLYPFVEHVLAPGLDSERLDLDSVAEEMLGENKQEMSWEDMKNAWSEQEGLEEFADYALKDAELALELGNEIAPQILELSRLTGLIPFDACRLTYGQLTENFLLKEAFEKDILAANRPTRSERRKRQRKGGYSGGFVYTPEPGLHENIVLFDFKSLYPTVMVAHNISPDTLELDDCDKVFNVEEFGYEFCQDEQGFFPELVERLVRDRSEIKQEMAEAEEGSKRYKSLYNRQAAEKYLANSFYGYLGYNGARWYSRECAEAITYLGRQHIQETIEKAEERGFEVVYGDSLNYSRQIIVKNPQGRLEFIQIGEFVENTDNPEEYETLAWDVDQSKAVFKPVRRAIMHDYEGKLLRFSTNRGRTTVTPQHSVYKYEDDQIMLADAEKLEKGDYLISLSEPPEVEREYSEGDLIDLADFAYDNSELRAYRDNKEFPAEMGECPYCKDKYYLSSHVHAQHPERKVKLERATAEYSYIGCKNAKAGKIPRFLELSSEFAWVLGFYCGDGSASTGNKQMISFGGQDRGNIQRVKEFFDKILEDKLAIIEDVDTRTGNKMYYYRVQRKSMTSFFVEGLDLGRSSASKKVPDIILNGDKELRESFIEGYLEADGSKEKDHDSRYNSESVRFSTKSSYLANQVQYILKQLELGENGYGREINDVSYKYRDDKPQIKSIRNTAPQDPEFAELNFTPARIKDIEKVSPTKDRVYDLEVEGQHNFVDAEGLILVHNTDSVFLKKENIREEMDEYLEEANENL